MAEAFTFIVSGNERVSRGAYDLALPGGLTRGRVKHSVIVGTARGVGAETRIDAVAGEDVVVLHIVDGPLLVLHPETAHDLFLAQSQVKRRGRNGGPAEVTVPAQLEWRGLEHNIVTTQGRLRGVLGSVLLAAVEVVTGVAKRQAAEFIASAVADHVDSQVDTGVYRLAPEELPKLKGNSQNLVGNIPLSDEGEPILVLVHGTFSTTSGTFGKLWTLHPERVRSLFEYYDNRVYALEHPTLTQSPITNALELARALPENAKLHLLTHSRGGLVAEVLARVCAKPDLDEDDYKPFSGDGYQTQRADLEELAKLVAQKTIRVKRIVRVACPARGTLLASKRLDAYLSVFRWSLEVAGLPVAPEIVDFLSEVALKRTDPESLPGLAAQTPDNPLMQWLHAADDPFPGELRVVAGDVEGDSITTWLKTLLADAYYWTDNDLVVQTRSMYGGMPRSEGASFMLHQDGKVSHFKYFSNEQTTAAIVDALKNDTPQGFRTIGPLSWAGESSKGTRGARFRSINDRDRSASTKPAVFILPGILGSHLRVNGKRVWLSWRIINSLTRLKYDSRQPNGVEPDGAIETTYDDLEDFLSASHEVIEFDYDWRLPIEDEARRLAARVEAALAAREANGMPVRLLAHSMGGLVARTMQLECPQIWERMMSRPGARLLMLGTPNGGSWAPMQVLSGDDTFGNTLIAFGALFQDHKARDMIARFPGFIQLQADLLNGALGLDKSQTWKQLADEDLKRVREHNWWHNDERQLTPYKWGVPPQHVLDRAVALRKRLNAQVLNDLSRFNDRISLVLGNADFTPDGYVMGDEGLVYLDTRHNGDGRVTLPNALLPAVRAWTLDCEHGKLPKQQDAFEAYLALLEHGHTNRLQVLQPEATTARGEGAVDRIVSHVRTRPARTRNGLPPESTSELFTLPSRLVADHVSPIEAPLRITVVNGNLKFVRQPLMLGHYHTSTLTGTERVMDDLIGGMMSEALAIGQYPDLPATQQVFINIHESKESVWQLPRPEAVIVLGLGQEGKLKASGLIHTVRQGVITWAQRMAELGSGAPARFELAATLIGSGGSGISAGQAARSVAQGVHEANERLAKSNWPQASHLQLIELYLDRATEAWRALQVLATANPGYYLITETIQTGTGPLRRPLDSSYRGTGYDFITAVSRPDGRGGSVIAYTLDTKRARAEVNAQAAQSKLVRELVATASNETNRDMQIGRTLFRILVPIEMEPYLGGTTEMQIELDSMTAGIPWELLDTSSGTRNGSDTRPWAIRAKLLRRLRTADFRQQTSDADRSSHVLIIGEPECDPAIYPRLPGARKEANAVHKRLTSSGLLSSEVVKALISSDDPSAKGIDARTVITTLLTDDWRVVHIAGHGEPPEKIGPAPVKDSDPPQIYGDPRGVVLSNGIYLGPREIETMRTVPELVFVNCCHVGASGTNDVLKDVEAQHYDRPLFASGVADALIKIGVRCVVAAGWAVDDEAAKTFATTFYDALLRGERFIDAVATAREQAWKLGGNTWAAYQCYGDPDWLFLGESREANRSSIQPDEEFANVASAPMLTLVLETLAINARFQRTDPKQLHAKISYLEKRFAPLWGGTGAVAESFGLAWAEADDFEKAIRWYEAALAANDASASIKVSEQLGLLQAQLAWESVVKATLAKGNKSNSLTQVLSEARKHLKQASKLLEELVELYPTVERETLCASAYKRLSMIERAANHPQEEVYAVENMRKHYGKAELLAQMDSQKNIVYPTLNRLAAEFILDGEKPGWEGFDRAAVSTIRQTLNTKVHGDPDFWSVAGLIELQLYECLANRNLASARSMIEQEFEDLHKRVTAIQMWKSVRDQGRFMLPKYIDRVNGEEARAAKLLLKRMEAWAGSARA